MPARPFHAEVVEGCIVRVSDALRPRASALIHALVERMKAHGHETVAHAQGRFRGRCCFRFGECLCEVYVQEHVTNEGTPGAERHMKPTGNLYMGVRIAKRLHQYWFEPDGEKLEDKLDEFIVELERRVQFKECESELALVAQHWAMLPEDARRQIMAVVMESLSGGRQ